MKTNRSISECIALLGASLLLAVAYISSYPGTQDQLNLVTKNVDIHDQMSLAGGAEGPIYRFPSCPTSRSLYAEMTGQLNNRIAGITVRDNEPRSTNRDVAALNSWANGLDFSGHSNYTGDDQYGLTLITPKHALIAWHLLGWPGVYVDQNVQFIDVNGASYWRVVKGVTLVPGTVDLALVLLDLDLPNTVKYYPIIRPIDLALYAPPFLPVIFKDLTQTYLIRKSQQSGMGIGIGAYPANSPYHIFGIEMMYWSPGPLVAEMAVTGDSGNPAFYLINNALFLASIQHSAPSGSSVGASVNEINQAISDLGQNENNYQVTTVDMSCFDPYTPTSIAPQTFSISRTLANNAAVGTVALTRTNSASTAGFTIESGNVGGVFAIDSSGRITVTNASVLSSQSNTSYTLGISMNETWPAPDDQVTAVRGSITINVSGLPDTGTPHGGGTPPGPDTPPVNHPPEMAPIGNKSINVNVSLSFTIQAADIDGDNSTDADIGSKLNQLTYSATGLPSGATLAPATGQFYWKPVASQIGTHSITFKVTDPQGANVTETIVVTVNPAVVIMRKIVTTAGAGGTITPSGTISIPNGNSQSFTVVPDQGYAVASVSVDGSNVSLGQGTYTFSNVTADHSIVATFVYTVDETAPSITSFTIPQISSSLTVPITTLLANDTFGVTGYMITQSSTKPPANAPSGWIFPAPETYTVSSEGSKTLYAWAKDSAGNISTSRSDTVVVTLPNNPPIANAGLNQSVTLPAATTLTAIGSSDADGDALTYAWSMVSGPGSVTFSGVSNISPTAEFSEAGTYVIRVTVSDGKSSATDQTTVVVNLTPATTYILSASAGSHGSITPSGTATVVAGQNQVYDITADHGYIVQSLIIDGAEILPMAGTYTFTNVRASHTIAVTFATEDTPPSVPGNLAVSNVTSQAVSLAWLASTANIAVTGYKVYRDGVYIAAISSGTSYVDTTVSASTQYAYAVTAIDGAGNESVKTSSISVTTSAVQAAYTPPPPVMNNYVVPPPSQTPTPDYTPPPAVQSSNLYVTYTPVTGSSNFATSPTDGSKTYIRIQQLVGSASTTEIDFTFTTTTPSLQDYVWSHVTETVQAILDLFQTAVDRVVEGVKSTLKLGGGK